MTMTRTAGGLAAAALLTACAPAVDDAPTQLTGDAHILDVAESVGGWDVSTDDERAAIIELGHMTCNYLDRTDGDFHGLDRVLGQASDDPVVTTRVAVTALAGIPAYCAHWTDPMIEWAEASD